MVCSCLFPCLLSVQTVFLNSQRDDFEACFGVDGGCVWVLQLLVWFQMHSESIFLLVAQTSSVPGHGKNFPVSIDAVGSLSVVVCFSF